MLFIALINICDACPLKKRPCAGSPTTVLSTGRNEGTPKHEMCFWVTPARHDMPCTTSLVLESNCSLFSCVFRRDLCFVKFFQDRESAGKIRHLLHKGNGFFKLTLCSADCSPTPEPLTIFTTVQARNGRHPPSLGHILSKCSKCGYSNVLNRSFLMVYTTHS